MRIAGIIALIVMAFYLVKFLIWAGRSLGRLSRSVAARVGGKPMDGGDTETKVDLDDAQLQFLFPGGEEEIEQEVRKLRSVLVGLYPGHLIKSVFVDASLSFALSDDKSEGKLIDHILVNSNESFSDYDAKVLHDFIYTRVLRLSLDLEEEQLELLNDLSELTGCDADEVPEGSGAFGLSADNPIPVKGIVFIDYYLIRLRTWKGERITWERVGSTHSAISNKPVDVYRIFDLEGEEVANFYISPYHKRVSNKAPEGFRLLTRADLDPAAGAPAMASDTKMPNMPPAGEVQEPPMFINTITSADGKTKSVVVGDMRLLAASTALIRIPFALLMENQKDARESLEEAVKYLDKFPGPDDGNTVTLLMKVATYARQFDDAATAGRMLERALAAEEAGLGTQDQQHQADIRIELGELFAQQGDYSRAAHLLRQSLEILQQQHNDPDPEKTAKTMFLLGKVLQNGPALEEAENILRQALLLIRRTTGKETDLYATALDHLARALLKLNKTDEAATFAAEAYAIQLQVNGPNHPHTACTMGTQALIHKRNGQYADAEKLQRKLLPVLEKADGKQHQLIYGIELGNLAGTLMQQGDVAGAIPLYYKALETKEASLGTDHPGVVHTLTNLACLHAERKEFIAAVSLAKRAYDIHLAAYGDLHPETQESFMLYQQVEEDRRLSYSN